MELIIDPLLVYDRIFFDADIGDFHSADTMLDRSIHRSALAGDANGL